MSDKLSLSRRAMVRAALSAGLLRFTASSFGSGDRVLIQAKDQFDRLQRNFDYAAHNDEAFWNEFDLVCTEIVQARATTMSGFLVKAQIAAWVRLGDLEPPSSGQLDTRLSISLMRDIILLGDPALYDPGALKRLCPE